MQEGIYKLHMLQIFLSSVSAQRPLSRLRSQTWSEKYEQTSNFNVAEFSRQESVCGYTNGKSKKGRNGFRLSIIFSYQYRHYNAKVGRKDKPGLNTMKKTETSTEQNSLYQWLFVALSMRNQRGNRGALDSSGALSIETMCDSTRR